MIQQQEEPIKARKRKNRLKEDSINQVFAEVILGRPSAKCKHLGICKITSVHTTRLNGFSSDSCNNCNKVYALISAKGKAFFEVAFLKSSIDKNVLDQHFKDAIFKVEESYTTDKAFMDTAVTIKTGIYTATITETFITVRFDIH